MSETPRTDKEERWAEWNGEDFKCVHVEFAQELERELRLAIAGWRLEIESERGEMSDERIAESWPTLASLVRKCG